MPQYEVVERVFTVRIKDGDVKRVYDPGYYVKSSDHPYEFEHGPFSRDSDGWDKATAVAKSMNGEFKRRQIGGNLAAV